LQPIASHFSPFARGISAPSRRDRGCAPRCRAVPPCRSTVSRRPPRRIVPSLRVPDPVRNIRPRSYRAFDRTGVRAVASNAKRFEIFQMMRAAENSVRTIARNDVVDLQAIRAFRFSPVTHRGKIRRMVRHRLFVRADRWFVSALNAAVLIAPLCSAACERPPMIGPKRITAFVAAPRTTPRRKLCCTPRTCAATRGCRKRTDLQERLPIGPLGDHGTTFMPSRPAGIARTST
jgi:hypothetical protein